LLKPKAAPVKEKVTEKFPQELLTLILLSAPIGERSCHGLAKKGQKKKSNSARRQCHLTK
jgi:hypothetical protein